MKKNITKSIRSLAAIVLVSVAISSCSVTVRGHVPPHPPPPPPPSAVIIRH